MSDDDKTIDAKLFGAPDQVQACASDGECGEGDKAYLDDNYTCLCLGIFKCPFQSKKYGVDVDGKKVPLCERYHPKFRDDTPKD